MKKDKINLDHKRHITKAITWRVLASLVTFTITFIATGNIEIGIGVGVFDMVIKLVLYYFHERLWYNVNWGIKHKRKINSD